MFPGTVKLPKKHHTITNLSDCCTDPECDKSHAYSAQSPYHSLSPSLPLSISPSLYLSISPSHPSPQSVSICANLWQKTSRQTNPCQFVPICGPQSNSCRRQLIRVHHLSISPSLHHSISPVSSIRVNLCNLWQ